MRDVILIGIISTIGLALMAVGFTVGTSAAAASGFIAANVCTCLGITIFAGSVTCWFLVSKLTRFQKSLSFALIAAAYAASVFLSVHFINQIETRTLPRLFPGSGADPEFSNPFPKLVTIRADAFKIFYGTNISSFTRFPHTMLRIGPDPMVVIDKDPDGEVVVTLLRIFDKDGNILVRFDEGEYWKSEGVRIKRPDKSTMIVYDRADREVLRMVYINPLSLRLTGIFNRPPYSTVVIDDKMLLIGTREVSGQIMNEFTEDIDVFQ